METLLFYVFFGLCFICFAFRTSYHVLVNRGSMIAENKRIGIALLVVMFLLWFSWFFINYTDPHIMNLPSWARYFGLTIFIIGVLLFVLSHLKIRGQGAGQFATSGVYSKIRHPMYLGFIIWIIGFPMFMNAPFALASAVIWIPHILYWRFSEEREMENKYEGYGEYKKRTWF